VTQHLGAALLLASVFFVILLLGSRKGNQGEQLLRSLQCSIQRVGQNPHLWPVLASRLLRKYALSSLKKSSPVAPFVPSHSPWKCFDDRRHGYIPPYVATICVSSQKYVPVRGANFNVQTEAVWEQSPRVQRLEDNATAKGSSCITVRYCSRASTVPSAVCIRNKTRQTGSMYICWPMYILSNMIDSWLFPIIVFLSGRWLTVVTAVQPYLGWGPNEMCFFICFLFFFFPSE
jgi:hypothetical protein